MAERVFSVLDLGDNPYFKTQAFLAFTRICRLLHGMVDKDGLGIPFNLRDVSVCIRGLSASDTDWGRALKRCLAASHDREAVQELRAQYSRSKGIVPPAQFRRIPIIIGGWVSLQKRSQENTRYQEKTRINSDLSRTGKHQKQLPTENSKMKLCR